MPTVTGSIFVFQRFHIPTIVIAPKFLQLYFLESAPCSAFRLLAFFSARLEPYNSSSIELIGLGCRYKHTNLTYGLRS
jgi:hypothetical protein